MRYIGNKTKLLSFLRTRLARAGVPPGGRAADPFTGTASVARMLKEDGFQVVAGDIMSYAYVFARAYVALDAEPDFSRLAGELDRDSRGTREARRPDLRSVLQHLEALEPEPGFLHGHYSPAGEEGRRHRRMYFTPRNAARIDAIRTRIARWHRDGLIDDAGRDVLLAVLIEAADRVANTTGVYASFVKSWQPNALQDLRLRPVAFTPRNGAGPSTALRADAETVVATAAAGGELDLLYLDPPYNTRQYPAYYHIPELIAEGWFEQPPPLRGKTGLIPDQEKRTDWSRRGRCETAFERLVASAPCRWIVMSYNDEGIIPRATIEGVFRACGDPDSFRCFHTGYRRYRADEDGSGRRYKTDRVREYLFCVRKRW